MVRPASLDVEPNYLSTAYIAAVVSDASHELSESVPNALIPDDEVHVPVPQPIHSDDASRTPNHQFTRMEYRSASSGNRFQLACL